eukprot:491712_1
MGMHGKEPDVKCYKPLIYELEVSYLGNLKDNFDQKIERFNHVLLPSLCTYLHKVLKITTADAYVFSVGFDSNKNITNIIQEAYTHQQRKSFPRTIVRFLNGRNSLWCTGSNSSFIQLWLQKYKLLTPQQQYYFFSWILCITTQLKYIDIEFLNKLVLIPETGIIQNTENKKRISDMIEKIDTTFFNRSKSNDSNIFNFEQISQTGVLRELRDDEMSIAEHEDEQNEEKYNVSVKPIVHEITGSRYTEDESILLRLAELIRKFVCERELGHSMWPWYKTSYHIQDTQIYNEIMTKYDLVQEYNIATLKSFARFVVKGKCTGKCKVCAPAIRHRRKFAAMILLKAQILKNLNVIKKQLDLWINLTLNVIKTQTNADNNNEQILVQISDYIEKNQMNTNKYWSNAFTKVYKNAKNKPYDPILESLNIDKQKYPLFEQFMYHFFIETDKKRHEKHVEDFSGPGHYFMSKFMDYWRHSLPIYYSYKHDIVLLQVIMRNGVNMLNIKQDLITNASEYKFISNTKDDVIFEQFIKWYQNPINLFHRLRYITNTILMKLHTHDYKHSSIYKINVIQQEDINALCAFSGNSIIFSDYQKSTIVQYFSGPSTSHRRIPSKPPSFDKRDTLWINSKKRISDPFQTRDIELELLEAFHSVDLMKYGKALTLFIIHILELRQRESYYFALGELFYILPDPIVIEILKHSMSIWENAKPQVLRVLCTKIVNGSAVRPSAALSISEFFEELRFDDVAREDTWGKYSHEFAKIAFEEVNRIQTDHFLFILLNIPLPTHNGKCILQLAIEQKRVNFLNNKRITNVINHMYTTNGDLTPTDAIKSIPPRYSEMLHTLLFNPFKFYFSAEGYHWISGVIFVEYVILLFCFVYLWTSPDHKDADSLIFQIIFWCCNLGYILYEVFEWIEKGWREYFNFQVMGQTNVMDVFVSIIWIVLFILHMRILYLPDNALQKRVDRTENVHSVLLGVQVLIVTIRSLKIFSISKYFSKLMRVIKLMGLEIVKFTAIFIIAMVGILFAIWCVAPVNRDEIDDDSPINSIEDSIKFIFEVFIAGSDVSLGEDESIAYICMVVTTVFGGLILTNLLIALMNQQYESVQKEAQAHAVFNRAELAYDLSNRSRLMPPPLDIFVFASFFIVWFFNLFISLFNPKWNVFAVIHYELFQNLKQFNLWSCNHGGFSVNYETKISIFNVRRKVEQGDCCSAFGCYGKDPYRRTVNKSLYFQTMSRRDVLQWYCCCKKKYIIRIHHKGCHGQIKMYSKSKSIWKNNSNPVESINMEQYFDLYERYRKWSILKSDKMILKDLTSTTLFCSKCYKSFLNRNESLEKELESPFIPLFDFLSAIVFVVIPVVWIPLIILIGLAAFKDWLEESCRNKQHYAKHYSNQDYDRDYNPQYVYQKLL